ncbi:MAG: DUF87 domain-containing protein [Candidatus Aenigmatarchaeota archaeon]
MSGKKKRAYLDMDILTSHAVLVGGNSSGKTIASMVIAEECLMKNISVIVFDPKKSWSGFSESCSDQEMLKCYNNFGLSKADTKGFKTNLIEVDYKNLNYKINEYIKKRRNNYISC